MVLKIQTGILYNCLPQLHYLVVAAFAWMLVEAANMYQLLITVFASSETHFMAKRVVAAWGEYAAFLLFQLVFYLLIYFSGLPAISNP